MVIRNDEPELGRHRARRTLRHIIVSPGPGRPERPRTSASAPSAIRESSFRYLGDLATRASAHALGGAVEHTLPADARTCGTPGSASSRACPRVPQQCRYHSLAVVDVPDELEIVDQEDDVVMGLRHRGRCGACRFSRSRSPRSTDVTCSPTSATSAIGPRATHQPRRGAPKPAYEVHMRSLAMLPRYAELAHRTSAHEHRFWLDSSAVGDQRLVALLVHGRRIRPSRRVP